MGLEARLTVCRESDRTSLTRWRSNIEWVRRAGLSLCGEAGGGEQQDEKHRREAHSSLLRPQLEPDRACTYDTLDESDVTRARCGVWQGARGGFARIPPA